MKKAEIKVNKHAACMLHHKGGRPRDVQKGGGVWDGNDHNNSGEKKGFRGISDPVIQEKDWKKHTAREKIQNEKKPRKGEG